MNFRYELAGFGRDAAVRASASAAAVAAQPQSARFLWLVARLSLVRRGDAAPGSLPRISTARDASRFVHSLLPKLKDDPQENAGVIALDVRHQAIAVAHVYRGSLESVASNPSNILRPVLLVPAVSFIKWHTHPSGNPSPSAADLNGTRALVRGARAVGLHCLDHVILTGDQGNFYSIREHHADLWR